jgi:hypothetical protein
MGQRYNIFHKNTTRKLQLNNDFFSQKQRSLVPDRVKQSGNTLLNHWIASCFVPRCRNTGVFN